jgi:hypothetical protein
MCKAGFAGDDAPRAVFRKSFKGETLLNTRHHAMLLVFKSKEWC